jgi:hypothetical protein
MCELPVPPAAFADLLDSHSVAPNIYSFPVRLSQSDPAARTGTSTTAQTFLQLLLGVRVLVRVELLPFLALGRSRSALGPSHQVCDLTR